MASQKLADLIIFATKFLDISGLKEFKMFSKALDTVNPVPEEPNLDPLMHMLVNNCPELEVQILLDLSFLRASYLTFSFFSVVVSFNSSLPLHRSRKHHTLFAALLLAQSPHSPAYRRNRL